MWKARNAKLWDEVDRDPAGICSQAASFLAEWYQARGSVVVSHQNPDRSLSWSPPPVGFLKCNVDVSFSQDKGVIGWGMCLRDHLGGFMGARSSWSSPCLAVQEGEGLGLLAAVDWVRNLGHGNVIFEVDCKLLADSINKPRTDFSEFGCISLEFSRALSFSRNFSVRFVRRQANETTHCLVKVAPSLSSFQDFYHVPLCIASVISSDMN